MLIKAQRTGMLSAGCTASAIRTGITLLLRNFPSLRHPVQTNRRARVEVVLIFGLSDGAGHISVHEMSPNNTNSQSGKLQTPRPEIQFVDEQRGLPTRCSHIRARPNPPGCPHAYGFIFIDSGYTIQRIGTTSRVTGSPTDFTRSISTAGASFSKLSLQCPWPYNHHARVTALVQPLPRSERGNLHSALAHLVGIPEHPSITHQTLYKPLREIPYPRYLHKYLNRHKDENPAFPRKRADLVSVGVRQRCAGLLLHINIDTFQLGSISGVSEACYRRGLPVGCFHE